MKTRKRPRLLRRSGFTLSETLVAILILLLVTSTVAAVIPAATNAYEKLVTSANAEVLLSTTMTCLRDELGTATNVSCEGTTLDYTSGSGAKSRIYIAEHDGGIYLREYVGVSTSPDYDNPLVSKEAANKNLHVTYEIESYANGVITFRNLEVKKGVTTITGVDRFEVRVISDLT